MAKPDWSNICNRVDTCALSGAAALFTGVPRAEVLVNGPLWCYFYALRYLENVDNDASKHFCGTQPDNNAIVFGTEKYILETLNRFKTEDRRADVLFIESSCALSLIGDDVAGIARKAELPYPVVTLSSGGVLGGFAEGFEKAAMTLLDSLELEAKNSPRQNINGGARRKLVVNVLGLTPYYYNGKADAREILRLLELAELSVNVKLGCGSSYDEIKHIGAADLNIVIHAQLGIKTARYLQERLGTPFVCAGMPYGTEGTRAWLAKIAAALKALDAPATPDMSAAYADCDKTRDYLYGWMNDFSSGWGELWYDRVLVSAPGSVALALADAVRGEWLDTAEMTVICQNDMTESGIVSVQADRVLTAGRDGAEIDKTLRGFHDGLILGSSSEFSLLLRGRNRGVTRVGVAYPMLSEVNLIRVPYCGTRGAVRMLEKLANLHIQNKLAKQIR